MKRTSFFVLFFYCCSFVHPPQARAVAPLALLAPAAVGAAAFAVAGTYFAFKPDHSGGSYTSDGKNVTVPLVAYKPFILAGAEKLLGKSVTAALDAARAFKDNVLQGYNALSGIVDDYFGLGSPPGVGDVLDPESLNAPTSTGECPSNMLVTSIFTGQSCILGQPLSLYKTCSTTKVFVYTRDGNCANGTPRFSWTQYVYTPAPPDQDQTYPGTPPPYLGPADVPEISNRFAQAAPIRPEVKDELDNLLKNHPEYWPIANSPTALPAPNNDISDYPPAQPISPTEVSQWAQGQSAGAQQNYIDTLQDLVDANPSNPELAAELAEAQAQQAKEEAEDIEDNFDPISSSPFDTPYDPGLFHIPTRFASFLDNVKSTGLFSFSSAFFNSLPGGGSPIYTVDAGTYGTHTIDLSETMGTGLAVLKTVLLLLFGFLSIRVVILKR